MIGCLRFFLYLSAVFLQLLLKTQAKAHWSSKASLDSCSSPCTLKVSEVLPSFQALFPWLPQQPTPIPAEEAADIKYTKAPYITHKVFLTPVTQTTNKPLVMILCYAVRDCVGDQIIFFYNVMHYFTKLSIKCYYILTHHALI